HLGGPLSEASFVWLLWSFDFNDAHPELVAQYPIMNDIYLNMQTLWEHYTAHYLYAAGAMIMSWVQIFAFRNQIHGPLPLATKIVWCIGTIVYGLLLAAVAIEFPKGLIVGVVYTIVLAVACTSLILLKRQRLPRGGLFTMGRRMVIQFYLGACIIAFVIIIIWIGKFGLLNRKAAGIAT
ncbi:hypothetical protein BDF20DRAFT_814859, partial [Mycotypha africana]|uniref:uncharacterized protein n=1 Tax=Mycotypha africana TaxID=64632 RepID=UPI0023019664